MWILKEKQEIRNCTDNIYYNEKKVMVRDSLSTLFEKRSFIWNRRSIRYLQGWQNYEKTCISIGKTNTDNFEFTRLYQFKFWIWELSYEHPEVERDRKYECGFSRNIGSVGVRGDSDDINIIKVSPFNTPVWTNKDTVIITCIPVFI